MKRLLVTAMAATAIVACSSSGSAPDEATCGEALTHLLDAKIPWNAPGNLPVSCQGFTHAQLLDLTLQVAVDDARQGEIGVPTARPSNWRDLPEYR